jgi:hypothetical protein
MCHSVKPRWMIRTFAAPLLLSLALHGLLLLALWYWPTGARSPTLSIESTRITLEACIRGSHSATLLPPPELPPELLGSEVNTSLAPRLEAAPPPAAEQTGSVRCRVNNPAADGMDHPAAHAAGSPLNSSHSSLFSLPATAGSVVYVLDRSVSMGIGRKLDFARRELIASLRRLPPSVRFQVIDYNEFAESLIVEGQRDLLPAEPAIVERAIALLEALDAAGSTNHLAALRRGLELHPDVLFFLTDADDLKPEVISAITQRNQRSLIHTIKLTRLREPHAEGPLERLARDNHGTYRPVAIGDSP